MSQPIRKTICEALNRHKNGKITSILKTTYQDAHVVMLQVCSSFICDINESCHTYEWVMSHKRMSHVPRIRHSYVWHEWVMSYIWMSHVPQKNESCPTYSSFICMTWMSHVIHMNEPCSSLCVMAYSHVCHGSFICLSWHTYERVMSHKRMRHVPRMSHVLHMSESWPRDEWVTRWCAPGIVINQM